MSFPSMLYTLLISPLEILFEILYNIAFRMIHNPGLSIIVLSLIMNFLLLPLYQRTDKIQMDAIDTEKKLKPFVDHIKKTFKGDEQFMILQTCYRQHHYKPTDALKGLSPLLLEIPFFMAAYNFLSGLDLLHGASLGPIHDLGSPDGLLVIGSLAINVLPILMTVINLISGAIYTKGAPLKTKVQLYGMAAVFLVLLYGSPSGLVFYWTLNNLFSLVKNMFMKLKKPGLALCILSSLSSAAMLVFVLFFHPMDTHLKQYLLVAVLLTLQLPLVIYLTHRHSGKTYEKTEFHKANFFAGTIFMTILIGLLIPSSVIKASPAEFINMSEMSNPLIYLLGSVLLAVGTFLIWFSVFYMLASPKGKNIMELGIWMIAGVSLLDYMFFGTDYGTLLPNLQYVNEPQFDRMLVNLAVAAAVALVLFLVWKKKAIFARLSCGVLSLAMIAMSVFNMVGIQSVYADASGSLGNIEKDNRIIPLSKDGKNVIVLMMDRAISGYIPYIMNEKPELQKQFAGFTYYPNTMSYGGFTNVGTPPLYGGYDYTPVEINRRDQESLCSKQNESLKVMPVLFDNHNFQVTVCDPSYAGYSWIPDLSIYDEYPDIKAHITNGQYHLAENSLVASESDEHKSRNFFCYGLFRSVPVALQSALYDSGSYNAPAIANVASQQRESVSISVGTNSAFTNTFDVLTSLPYMTDIQEHGGNTFLMMSNDTTHEPMLLQEPDYIPALYVDNTEYDAEHADRFKLEGFPELVMDTEYRMIHYQANMAALIQLGNWFDYLRQNDVFDNTRIIIVSDHGNPMGHFENMILGDEKYEDLMHYNPLLMVKDFNSTEFTQDNRFMTNADVPTLATDGVVLNPVNPFTGHPINSDLKEGVQYILYTDWNTANNHGNTFLPGHWFSVHDDIFKIENWKAVADTDVPN